MDKKKKYKSAVLVYLVECHCPNCRCTARNSLYWDYYMIKHKFCVEMFCSVFRLNFLVMKVIGDFDRVWHFYRFFISKCKISEKDGSLRNRLFIFLPQLLVVSLNPDTFVGFISVLERKILHMKGHKNCHLVLSDFSTSCLSIRCRTSCTLTTIWSNNSRLFPLPVSKTFGKWNSLRRIP